MKRVAGLAIAFCCALFAGCATTGDPRQGGLFGWSESQARVRQEERQLRVAGAETELDRTTQTAAEWKTREARAERNLANAERHLASSVGQQRREEDRLRARCAALVAQTEQLERDSPTPATASRARALRLRVTTIAAQAALSPAARTQRLLPLEAEIDDAAARIKR